MLLYAHVESIFLAACVLFHGVFLLPEYRYLLSNATIVYLGYLYLIKRNNTIVGFKVYISNYSQIHRNKIKEIYIVYYNGPSSHDKGINFLQKTVKFSSTIHRINRFQET